MMVHLVSEQGRAISVENGNLLLGRGSLLGIDDKKLSRNQALIIVSESGTVQLIFTGKNPMYMIKNDNSAPLQKVPLKKGQIYFLHHGDRFSLLQDKYWFTVQFEQLQPPSSSSPQPEQQKQDSLSTSSVNPPTLIPSQSVQKFRNIVPSPKKPTTPSLLFSTTHTTSPSRRTKLSVVKENGAQFVAPPPPPLPHHKLTFQQNENTKPQNDTASHVSNTSNSLPQTGQTNETSKTNNENNVELIDPIDSDSSNNSDQFPFQFSQKRKREDDGSGPPLKYPKIEEEIPKCHHNLPAIIKTVSKEGPTKGRMYWTCGMASGRCDFFQWAGAPKCEHGLPCTRLTVKKEGINKGRQFWTCAQANRCHTFRWIKEGE